MYGWILVILVAGWPACYLLGAFMGSRGHGQQCRDERTIAVNTAVLAERRRAQAGRHSKSQPRTGALPSSPSAAAPPHPRRRPETGRAGAPQPPRRYTSAADLFPVTWTGQGVRIPSAPQSAGDKNGADDTGILAPVKLSPNPTTGEIRAVGDRFQAWIHGERVS